jgi:hypothetical protein
MELRCALTDVDEQGSPAVQIRLARDYERLPETFAGLRFVVFSGLMPAHFVDLMNGA